MLGRRELLERIDALIEDTRREVDDIDIDGDLLSDSGVSYIDADRTDADEDEDVPIENDPTGVAPTEPVHAVRDAVQEEGPVLSSVAALQVFIHTFLPINIELIKGVDDDRQVCIGFRFLDFGTILIFNKGFQKRSALKFECGKSCLLRSADMAQIRGEAKSLPMYIMLLQRGSKDPDSFRLLSSTALDVSDMLRHHDQWHSGTYDCFDLMGRVNGTVRMRMRFTNYGSSLLPHIVRSPASGLAKNIESKTQHYREPNGVGKQRNLAASDQDLASAAEDKTASEVALRGPSLPIFQPAAKDISRIDYPISLVQPIATVKRKSTSLVKQRFDAPLPLYFKNWPIDHEKNERTKEMELSRSTHTYTAEADVPEAAQVELRTSQPSRWKIRKTRTQRIREEASRKRLEKTETALLHRRPVQQRAVDSSRKGKKEPERKLKMETNLNEDFLQVFETVEQVNARYTVAEVENGE